MARKRILFVGDSITLGLGAGGDPFPTIVERALLAHGFHDFVIHNASINGGVVASHVNRLDSHLAFEPDIAVLYIGSVDAIPVARRDRKFDLIGLLPPRYRQPGWLQPRPYLPRRWWKRVFYAVPESFLRTRFNRVVMRLQGRAYRTSLEQFRADFARLVHAFTSRGTACIVCGLGTIDESMFPGASQGFVEYGQVIRSVAVEYGCEFVEIDSVYNGKRHYRDGLLLLDNFHPSHEGHKLIAEVLLSSITSLLGPSSVDG